MRKLKLPKFFGKVKRKRNFGKILASALFIGSTIFTHGCATIPQTTQKVDKLKPRIETSEEIQGEKKLCTVNRNHLEYHYGSETKKLDITLGNEKVLGIRCGSEKVLLLTDGAAYLYPGMKEMKFGEPEDFDYIDIRFGIKIDEGKVSKTDYIFIIRSGNTVESYKVTKVGINSLTSNEFEVPIKEIILDDLRKEIVIKCEGWTFKFDYDGKSLF